MAGWTTMTLGIVTTVFVVTSHFIFLSAEPLLVEQWLSGDLVLTKEETKELVQDYREFWMMVSESEAILRGVGCVLIGASFFASGFLLGSPKTTNQAASPIGSCGPG